MNTNLLEELGLTKNEIRIYLALLELGSTPAGPLIKRVGMHRAAVYDIISMLTGKGLVSYIIKANRKYFEAQDPDRLLEYLESKKQEITDKEAELKKILPELQLKRKLSQEEQEGALYKSKKGLKSIFEDILKEKKPWLVFGATGKFKEIFHAYFTHFHEKRAKLKIPLKIIFNDEVRKQKRETELKLCRIRYLPDSYLSPSTTFIYGDKVVIINWSPDPVAFLMRSRQVADSYKSFFEILWKTTKN
jgi:sugar-specific transcriptional regulator TrmB